MGLRGKVPDSIDSPYLVILFILMAVGATLRFYSLGGQSVWFDEAISGIAAKGLLSEGFPVLPSGIEYSRAMLHTIFVALSYVALGFGEFAGRVPAAILGVFSIPLSFLVGNEMKNKRVGLMLAFFVTFATVQIAWSRQIRFYQQLQFFFLLTLYFFEKLLDKMNWRYLLLTLVSLGFMTVSHDSLGYLLAIPFPIWFLIEKLKWMMGKAGRIGRIKLKNRVGVALLAVVLLFVIMVKLPELSAYITRALGNNVDYISNYLDHFRAEMGGFFFLAVPGAFLGILERRRNLFYVFSFLLPFYVISEHVVALQHRYVLTLFPILFAFSALTIDYVYERVREFPTGLQKKKVPLGTVVSVVVVVIILTSVLSAANFTFTPRTRYGLGRTAPQGEFRPAYRYIEDHWKGGDVMVSTLTPVTWFYLQRSQYWISFSHWGFHTLPDEDRYTDAEVIQRLEDIQRVTNENHGWVVIDLMGMSRANHEVLEYIKGNLDHVEEASGRGVWVYRW